MTSEDVPNVVVGRYSIQNSIIIKTEPYTPKEYDYAAMILFIFNIENLLKFHFSGYS